jgi:hypothetical protein
MTGGYAVNAQGTPDMTLAVSAGTAYADGVPSSQNSQTFRIKSSAEETVAIAANSSGSTKYDYIYLQLNATELNNPNTAGSDASELVVSRSTSNSTDDGTPPTYGILLAIVTVVNGATSITNGSIRDLRTQVELNTGTANAVSGWNSLSGAITTATGYNSGNRSFELTTTTDQTAVVSEGMRFKVNRAVTPPTQCADLESGSSQYASAASPDGITFTDDFTCEAWIKLESYTGSSAYIISRLDGPTAGWSMRIGSSGQLESLSCRIASNNRTLSTYQSIPLNKWVHVAFSTDNSTNSHAMYIDGVSVPFSTSTTGTITAIVQPSVNLTVGARSDGTLLFDGKTADVRVWSDIRTADEIRDNMYAYPSDTTGLVAHFKLNGGFTDASSNSNDLTAQNSAVATNVDNPWNATEYGIITNVTSSTIQVLCPEGHGIPNETLSAPFYSTQSAPFGFPRGRDKWEVFVPFYSTAALGTSTAFVNSSGVYTTVPIGAWRLSYKFTGIVARSSGTLVELEGALGETADQNNLYPETIQKYRAYSDTAPHDLAASPSGEATREYTSPTTLYVLDGGLHTSGAFAISGGTSMVNGHYLKAECLYL